MAHAISLESKKYFFLFLNFIFCTFMKDLSSTFSKLSKIDRKIDFVHFFMNRIEK